MGILTPGQILGKYRVIRLLGKGGMAEVYLASHQMLRNQVALKVLPGELAANQGMVSRFLREARSAAKLRHSHIMRIHDVDCVGGLNYFAMDYVEGETLTQVMEATSPLSEDQMLRISSQVLSALQEAHSMGIVHRDIKPDNIIIDKRGQAVVTDFGIARATGQTRLTSVGSFVGTVNYSSPEQARGRAVDPRSDLYSWGVVMYEMATGRTPFRGKDTSAVVYQHVHELPSAPTQYVPGLSPGLSALILGALEKKPDDRFSSAAEMLQAVARLRGERTGPHTRVMGSSAAGARPVVGSRAKVLLKEAAAMAEKGQWASAQALAEKAIALAPGLEEAARILQRAEKEAVRDDRIDQITSQAQACIGDEMYREAADLITQLAGISRDKTGALKWLQEVQVDAKESADLDAGLQRGAALEAAGDHSAALCLYQQLSENNPAHRRLAKALAKAEASSAALTLCRQAAELAEDGHLEQALERYSEAVDTAGDLAVARHGLEETRSRISRKQRSEALVAQACIQMEAGDGRSALEHLDEAHRLEEEIEGYEDLRSEAQQIAARQPPEPDQPEASHPGIALGSMGHTRAGNSTGMADPAPSPKRRVVLLSAGAALIAGLVALFMVVLPTGPQPQTRPLPTATLAAAPTTTTQAPAKASVVRGPVVQTPPTTAMAPGPVPTTASTTSTTSPAAGGVKLPVATTTTVPQAPTAAGATTTTTTVSGVDEPPATQASPSTTVQPSSTTTPAMVTTTTRAVAQTTAASPLPTAATSTKMASRTTTTTASTTTSTTQNRTPAVSPPPALRIAVMAPDILMEGYNIDFLPEAYQARAAAEVVSRIGGVRAFSVGPSRMKLTVAKGFKPGAFLMPGTEDWAGFARASKKDWGVFCRRVRLDKSQTTTLRQAMRTMRADAILVWGVRVGLAGNQVVISTTLFFKGQRKAAACSTMPIFLTDAPKKYLTTLYRAVRVGLAARH